MACLAGKVAFIIGIDIAVDLDMAQTVKEVEALDRRIVADQADVRDYDGLKAALDDGRAVPRLRRGPLHHRRHPPVNVGASVK
jgi:hypothetical protein